MGVDSSGYVDLRSDTVTRPSAAMRRAMAGAEVGDDWYGDDPSVNRLQDAAAELTGKQAALYLPTGTLCSQIALHVFVTSGHFVACEATAHVGGTEAASAAAMSGIAFKRIAGYARGLLSPGQVAAALEPDPYDVDVVGPGGRREHSPGARRVRAAGRRPGRHRPGVRRPAHPALPGWRAYLQRRRGDRGDRSGVRGPGGRDDVLPVQGARGAGRVGAGRGHRVHPGSPAAEDRVRRGVAAGGCAGRGRADRAARRPGRLAEDHARAQRLATGIAEILPGSVDPAAVETNIVFVDVAGTGADVLAWRDRLAAHGVLVTMVAGRVRMLTHADVTAAGIDAALAGWRQAAAELAVPEGARQ